MKLESEQTTPELEEPSQTEFKSTLAEYEKHYIQRSMQFKEKIETAKTAAKKAFYLKKMKKENKKLAGIMYLNSQ